MTTPTTHQTKSAAKANPRPPQTGLLLRGIIYCALGSAAMLTPLIGMMLGIRWAAAEYPALGQLIPNWFPFATIVAATACGLLAIAAFSIYIVLNPPATWPAARAETE